MIEYRIATGNDVKLVENLLFSHFHPFEPMLLGWITEGDVSDEDRGMILEELDNGHCIVAEDTEKKIIVGVAINSINRPDSIEEMRQAAEETQDPKWAECLHFFADYDEEVDFFKKYSTTESLQVHVLSVHQDYRGKSIGSNLVSETHKLASTIGQKYSTISCSSYFSQKIAEKLQMDLIYVKSYEDCEEKNGKKLINSQPPHTHIKTYVKNVQSIVTCECLNTPM